MRGRPHAARPLPAEVTGDRWRHHRGAGHDLAGTGDHGRGCGCEASMRRSYHPTAPRSAAGRGGAERLDGLLEGGPLRVADVGRDKYAGRVVARCSPPMERMSAADAGAEGYARSMTAAAGSPGASRSLPHNDDLCAHRDALEEIDDVVVVHADAAIGGRSADGIRAYWCRGWHIAREPWSTRARPSGSAAHRRGSHPAGAGCRA
jgi:hypothetical protein